MKLFFIQCYMRNSYGDKFLIHGGNKLFGEVTIQTSKNAVLPILASSIMADTPVTIKNVPDIIDVDNMLRILEKLGAKIAIDRDNITINPLTINNAKVDCELSKTMRSSVFLLGATLAKFKSACITLPGGCNIGNRPIDLHINAFKKLGVEVEYIGEEIHFNAKKYIPRTIKLKIPSVGATENIIEFACLQSGKTTIINPAKEPEIVDLCNFLSSMGAKIYGAGTNKITIYGVDRLKGVQYTPISDRIVAGTIMCAVAICGGDVHIKNAIPIHNQSLIEKLIKMGCQINIKNDIINIRSDSNLKSIGKITTGYYPKFPTDLQSIMLVVSTVSKGNTTIHEKIFSNRFETAKELNLLSANIDVVSNNKVVVHGIDHLNGAVVRAHDLRGGAGLVLAGLVAIGDTIVEDIHYIDRGYAYLEKMLSHLGADIKRIRV